MAIALEVGDFLQMRVWSTQAEQASVNTFSYQVNNLGGTGYTNQDACNAFATAIASDYKAILQNDATYNGVQCYVLRAGPKPAVVQAVATAGAGTGGAIGMSRQTAGITSYYTELAGSANRGRTYWPFPPTSDDTGAGIPNAAYLAAVQAVIVDLFNVFTTPGVIEADFVVLSRVGVLHGTPIQSWVTRTKWATQKRRGSYGRANTSPI